MLDMVITTSYGNILLILIMYSGFKEVTNNLKQAIKSAIDFEIKICILSLY